MGKSTPQTTTTSQSVNMGPWEKQQPYLTKAFSEANRLYDTYNPQYFQGSTVAGMTPEQRSAYDQITNMGGTVNPILGAQNATATDTINGKFLDPSTNPYLANTFTQAADAVTRQYQTATAPGTSAAFSAGGRYGSGARNQAMDQNNRALGDTLNNLATNIYGGNYQAERGRQMDAANNAGTYVGNNYLPGTAAANAQGAIQGQSQRELDDQVARWNFEQNLPYNKLNSYLAAVQGNYGQSGTSTGTQTQQVYSNPFGQVLGALLSGASAAGGLGWKPFG